MKSHDYDSKLKAQSSVGKCLSSTRPKKVHKIQSKRKVLLTVFITKSFSMNMFLKVKPSQNNILCMTK